MKDGGAVNIIQCPAMDKQLVETVSRYARPGRIMLLLPDELIPRRREVFAGIERAIRNIVANFPYHRLVLQLKNSYFYAKI